VNGKLLTFGVSGMLWNRSLVMYDVETKSHWSHILGRAMDGEMKGTRLQMLPSEMTTWDGWLKAHPGTTVLNLSRTHQGFTRDFYKDPAAWVYGWTVGRRQYHAGMDALARDQVWNVETAGEALLVVFDPSSTLTQLYSRRVDGRTFSFRPAGEGQMKDAETSSMWEMSTGSAISGAMKGKRLEYRLGMLSYRRAWNDFYPKSQAPEPR
jgi:hypothetical protein